MAAALIGSAWQITSRHGVTTTLGPLELATLRYAIPAMVLLLLWSRIGLFPRALSVWRLAVMLGGGLPFGLFVPLFTALGAWQLERERFGLPRMAGLGLIVAGIITFGASDGADGASGSAWLGDLLLLPLVPYGPPTRWLSGAAV